MTHRSPHSGRPRLVPLLAGVVLGVAAFGLVRLVALPPAPVTHYHANWAVFIRGSRLDLSGDRYMEDVARCKLDPTQVAPEDRVHLHNSDGDVVHVHAPGATWGHLLANLGFGIGDDYLVTPQQARYFSSPAERLTFVLNGKPLASVRNRVIRSGDRLLISFGPEPTAELLRTRFPRVASTAGAFNRLRDPASCGGSSKPGFWGRLRQAFWR